MLLLLFKIIFLWGSSRRGSIFVYILLGNKEWRSPCATKLKCFSWVLETYDWLYREGVYTPYNCSSLLLLPVFSLVFGIFVASPYSKIVQISWGLRKCSALSAALVYLIDRIVLEPHRILSKIYLMCKALDIFGFVSQGIGWQFISVCQIIKSILSRVDNKGTHFSVFIFMMNVTSFSNMLYLFCCILIDMWL